ncbi:MAG TPA: phage baseplate assembly protein V [Blastocatellia bacterium]|nr:phage baseplate assembly protein V [Blastocatellia bacterium]
MTSVARSRSTDKRYYGVVEAIVTDNNDPQKEGRIKLKFPMFDNELESEWCRVRQFYAGNEYGSFFIPEVGDEVLVAFIHGDLRLPIVLGGLYNGQDKPPSYRASDKDEKLVRTKGRHEILMDDTSGKKRVRIKTSGGHELDLSDQDKKITIKSTNGQQVTIDDQANKITIETSGKSIMIDGASGNIEMTGTNTIKLTALNIVLSGTSLKLGGDAASMSLVLGEALMALFNTHVHTCTAPATPSSPPVVQMTSAVLSQISKTS